MKSSRRTAGAPPKRRSQALAVALLAAALSGCAAVDQARQTQQQRDLASARETCARLTNDTPALNACLETQLAVLSYQRRRALEEQSAPGRVPSYGPRGQLCVPSAAGTGITC
jgi:hypothetical protein